MDSHGEKYTTSELFSAEITVKLASVLVHTDYDLLVYSVITGNDLIQQVGHRKSYGPLNWVDICTDMQLLG